MLTNFVQRVRTEQGLTLATVITRTKALWLNAYGHERINLLLVELHEPFLLGYTQVIISECSLQVCAHLRRSRFALASHWIWRVKRAFCTAVVMNSDVLTVRAIIVAMSVPVSRYMIFLSCKKTPYEWEMN